MDAARIQQAAQGLVGNSHEIAAQINAMGLTKVVPTLGGIGTIMRALGPEGGGAFLDQLEGLSATNSAVKWSMTLITAGTLDFGDTLTRLMIDQLVTDPAAAAALKAVAEVPDTTTYIEVGAALGI